jgi:hypothetical protein
LISQKVVELRDNTVLVGCPSNTTHGFLRKFYDPKNFFKKKGFLWSILVNPSLFLLGQRWSHTNLTWSLRRSPSHHSSGSQLARELVRRELGHALQVWAAHTQLTFLELFDSDRADIQVFFHTNYHGDGEGLFKGIVSRKFALLLLASLESYKYSIYLFLSIHF